MFVLRTGVLSFLSIVVLGFLLGVRHSTDPDHVVAVTTIASRERSFRAAAFIGVLWGLGHTLTIMLVGGAIILFRLVVPPHLGLGMEFCVAVMLVLLGAWNLRAMFIGADRAPHSHMVEVQGSSKLRRVVRPFVVGLVHGLAGSAAIALLVLASIHDRAWALAHLAVFGLGTIAGMLLITTTMAVPFALAARRFKRLHRAFGIASAVVSVAFGAALIYEIGSVHGLFTAHPIWTPE